MLLPVPCIKDSKCWIQNSDTESFVSDCAHISARWFACFTVDHILTNIRHISQAIADLSQDLRSVLEAGTFLKRDDEIVLNYSDSFIEAALNRQQCLCCKVDWTLKPLPTQYMITVNIRAAGGIDSHLTEEELQLCLVCVAKSVAWLASLHPLCLGVSTKRCPSTFRPKRDRLLDSAKSICDHLGEVAELIAPLSSFRVFSTPILRLGQVWGGTPRFSLQDGLVKPCPCIWYLRTLSLITQERAQPSHSAGSTSSKLPGRQMI